jgi:hypothetical protein
MDLDSFKAKNYWIKNTDLLIIFLVVRMLNVLTQTETWNQNINITKDYTPYII